MRHHAVAESELEVGDRLGPFHVEALLGEGGMGRVYRATDERDESLVALKILRFELHEDVYVRRFLREARAAQEVAHRHLVAVREAGQLDGRYFLAVDYVEGRPLDACIAESGPFSTSVALKVAVDVGSALDALHERGLVHRDVKPSNILANTEGDYLLTDFGLAKGPTYTALTTPKQVVGTLDYIAPEVIRGGQAGAASDLYALGCVVYECIVGEPPFAGKGVFEVGVAHLSEEPPDPRSRRSELPEGFAWALLQALEKDPARRPPSAIAYATMLHVAAEPTRR